MIVKVKSVQTSPILLHHQSKIQVSSSLSICFINVHREADSKYISIGSEKGQPELPNLLNYFIDLIDDNDAPLKADYFRFLSSTCKFRNNSVYQNQSKIYKLFTSSSIMKLVGKLKDRIELPTNKQQVIISYVSHVALIEYLLQKFLQLYHELTFLSDVTFGRNFQWLRELAGYFKFDYLLDNIWKHFQTNSMESLNSCFSKLTMTLYIDQFPLYRINRPNLCRVFNDVRFLSTCIRSFNQLFLDKEREREINVPKRLATIIRIPSEQFNPLSQGYCKQS